MERPSFIHTFKLRRSTIDNYTNSAALSIETAKPKMSKPVVGREINHEFSSPWCERGLLHGPSGKWGPKRKGELVGRRPRVQLIIVPEDLAGRAENGDALEKVKGFSTSVLIEPIRRISAINFITFMQTRPGSRTRINEKGEQGKNMASTWRFQARTDRSSLVFPTNPRPRPACFRGHEQPSGFSSRGRLRGSSKRTPYRLHICRQSEKRLANRQVETTRTSPDCVGAASLNEPWTGDAYKLSRFLERLYRFFSLYFLLLLYRLFLPFSPDTGVYIYM